MLVFPERVLAGDVPNQDFLHLYGPGSLWVLAGGLQGVRHPARRRAALRAAPADRHRRSAMYGLARYWGRTVALFCAVISLVIIVPPIGLTALAWDGGVALGLLGLLAALAGPRAGVRADPTKALRWALVGGIVSRLRAALPTRPRRRGRARPARRVVGHRRDAFKLRARHRVRDRRRRLPRAHRDGRARATCSRAWCSNRSSTCAAGGGSRSRRRGTTSTGSCRSPARSCRATGRSPRCTSPAQLTVWFFAAPRGRSSFLARRSRSGPSAGTARRFQARVLLAVALFSLGMVPQAMQRVDSAHFAWVSCVPFAFVPIAVLEILRVRARRAGRSAAARSSAASGCSLVMILADPAVHRVGVHATTSRRPSAVTASSFKIEHDGRVFYYGRQEVARGRRSELLAEVPKVAQARRPALRRHHRPAQDAALRGVPLLPAPRATRRRRTTSRWIPASRTRRAPAWRRTCARPTSRSSPARGTTGASRTTRASSAPTRRTRCSCGDFCLVGSYGVYRTGDPLYELFIRRPTGRPVPGRHHHAEAPGHARRPDAQTRASAVRLGGRARRGPGRGSPTS